MGLFDADPQGAAGLPRAGRKKARGGGSGGVGVERREALADEIVTLRLGYPVSANRYWRMARGHIVVSTEAKKYKKHVAAAALGVPIFRGFVHVTVEYHPRRTQDGKDARRFDLDNVIKVVLDSMNGIAYADDHQVLRLSAWIGESVPAGGLTVTIRGAQ